MSWLKNIFGPKTRLGEKPPGKARWVRPPNSIGKRQMNAEQIKIAEIGEAFIRNVFQSRGWKFEELEGPFLIIPDDGDQKFLEEMRKERGKGPDYQLWMIEFGNDRGFIRGLGDSEDYFHMIIDGYYG